MTALATAPAPTVRPVAWHRLAWVVWRRYRTTLTAIAVVLVVLSAYLVVTGLRMRSAYHAVQTCRPAHSSACQFQWQSFHNTYTSAGLLVSLFLLLPGIIGGFVGAPLLARELETGTVRYAWTQGVGRMRWAVALILPAGIGVSVIMSCFGALISWHNQPLVDAGIDQRLHPSSFSVTGPAAAAWTLAAFALGVLAGILWRRVLPALGTAFAVWFGLAYLAATHLRPHYRSPLTTTSQQFSPSDLTVDQWWTKGGAKVSDAQINQVLQTIGVQQHGSGNFSVQVGGGGVDPVQYLLSHGYTQVTSYQPDSRFWTFQWIEFGWLTLLAVILLATAFWLLRRRPA